jgi:hypothetical protein
MRKVHVNGGLRRHESRNGRLASDGAIFRFKHHQKLNFQGGGYSQLITKSSISSGSRVSRKIVAIQDELEGYIFEK